jgi:hypothetical protein
MHSGQSYLRGLALPVRGHPVVNDSMAANNSKNQEINLMEGNRLLSISTLCCCAPSPWFICHKETLHALKVRSSSKVSD